MRALAGVGLGLLSWASGTAMAGPPQKPIIEVAEVAAIVHGLGQKSVEEQRQAMKAAARLVRDAGLELAMLTPDARRSVAEALVPTLLDVLLSPDPDLRLGAAYRLGYLGAASVLDAYLQQTSRKALVVDKGSLAAALRDKGGGVLLPFLRLVRPWPPELREEVVRIAQGGGGRGSAASDLLAAGDREDRGVLIEILRTSVRARPVVARALKRVPLSSEEVRAIIDALAQVGDPAEQKWMMMALAGCAEQDPDVVAFLADHLESPDAALRDQAALLIGRMAPKWKGILPKLMALLERDLGVGASEAVKRIGPGPDLVDRLIAIVASERAQPETREHAMGALATLGRAARSALPAIRERQKRAVDDYERKAAEDAAAIIARAK